ncbi:conserved hypothetical protein [Ricinus communis]|uniref:Uncharacterized protein n=1 Tax=Ricinus communis TaxID=3988 RepID=B9RL77_RICCO|nr:conserved hypothetical protein [Ricinus communis]
MEEIEALRKQIGSLSAAVTKADQEAKCCRFSRNVYRLKLNGSFMTICIC